MNAALNPPAATETAVKDELGDEEAWQLVLRASGEISSLADFMLRASDVDHVVNQALAVRLRDLSNLISAASEGIRPSDSLAALGGFA